MSTSKNTTAETSPINNTTTTTPVAVSDHSSAFTGANVSSPAMGIVSNTGTTTLVDSLAANFVDVSQGIDKDTYDTMGVSSMNAASVIQRRSLLTSIRWDTEKPAGTQIYTGEFPRCLTSSTSFPGRNTLEVHEYFAAKEVEFTAQVSASPFSVGILQMLWTPSSYGRTNYAGTNPYPTVAGEMYDPENMVDTYSVLLNLGEGNTATLTVPLTNVLSVLRTSFPPVDQNNVDSINPPDSFYNQYGRIILRVFNPLDGVSADDQFLTIKLWAQLKEPQVSLLRDIHEINPSATETEGIVLGTMAAVGTALAAAAPSIAVGAATAGATALATSLAHKVGKKCTYYTEIGEDPMSMSLALSNDRRSILSLGYDVRDFEDSSTDLVDSSPETDLRAWCSRRSRIATLNNWDSSVPEAKVLWSSNIHPCMPTYPRVYTADGIDKVLSQSNVQAVAHQYSYWRGSMTITVEVVGNSYSRGALLLVYTPPSVSTPPTTLEECTSFPNAPFNIAEIRKVSFRVPYNNIVPWLKTPKLVDVGGNWQYNAPKNLGNFHLLVLNPIRTNDASKVTNYQINIYAHSDDIDFRLPDPNRNLAVCAYNTTPPESFTEGNLDPTNPTPGVNAFGSTANPNPTSLMGNNHTDLNQLLTRRTALVQGELQRSTYTKIQIPIPAIGLRGGISPLGSEVYYPVPSFYNAFSGAFAWQTGSQTLSIIFGNCAIEPVNVIAQIVYNGDQDFDLDATTRGVTTSFIDQADFLAVADEDASIVLNASVNNRREFGIPWYCDKQMLPAPVHYRTSPKAVVASYIPYAILKLFIHTPFTVSDDGLLSYSITTAVGPNFEFSQFMGAPKMQLFTPDYGKLVSRAPNPAHPRLQRRNAIRVRKPKVTICDLPIVRNYDADSSETEGRWVQTYSCPACAQVVTTFAALINHVQHSHLDFSKNCVRCPYCRGQASYRNFPSHNPQCKILDPVSCAACHHTSTTGEKHLNHARNNHSDIEFRFAWERVTGTRMLDGFSTSVFPTKPGPLFDCPRLAPTSFTEMDTLVGGAGLGLAGIGLAGLGATAARVNRILPTTNLETPLAEIREAIQGVREDSREIKDTIVGLDVPMLNTLLTNTNDTNTEIQNLLRIIGGTIPDFTSMRESLESLNQKASGLYDKLTAPNDNTLSRNDKARIVYSTMKTVRERSPEPIFAEILLQVINLFSPIDPGLFALGLKGIAYLLPVGSTVNDVLNSIIISSGVDMVEKLLPDSIKDWIGSVFTQAGELPSDEMDFGKAIILIVAFGFTTLLGLCSPTDFFKNLKKDFSFINFARATASLGGVMDAIKSIVKFVQEKYFGRDEWAGFDWLVHNRELVLQFQEDAQRFYDMMPNAILASPALRNEVIGLSETAKQIQINIMKLKTNSPVVIGLSKQIDFIIGMARTARVQPTGKIRVRPPVVVLQGESQQGKTFLASTLIPHYVQKLMGWRQEPVFLISAGKDEFLSGYAQQMITMIDDLLQMKEGKDLEGFFHMIGNAPYRVPMADLSEKGTQFLSELVLVTMNEPHPKVDKFVNFPPAVYKRLYGLNFHCRVRRQFLTDDGELNIDLLKDRGIQYNPDEYMDFYQQKYVRGERVPAVDRLEDGPQVKFYEIIRYTVEAIKSAEETVDETNSDEFERNVPDFPDNFLPENWYANFEAPNLNANQRRAQRIIMFERAVARIVSNGDKPSCDYFFKELQWILSQGITSAYLCKELAREGFWMVAWNGLTPGFKLPNYLIPVVFEDSYRFYDPAKPYTNWWEFWRNKEIRFRAPANVAAWSTYFKNNQIVIPFGFGHSSNAFLNFLYAQFEKVKKFYSAQPIFRLLVAMAAQMVAAVLMSITLNQSIKWGSRFFYWVLGRDPEKERMRDLYDRTKKMQSAFEEFAFDDYQRERKRKEEEDRAYYEGLKEKEEALARGDLPKSGSEASWYSSGNPKGGGKSKVTVLRPKASKPASKDETKTESDVPELFPIVKKNVVHLTINGGGFKIRGLGWKADKLIVNRHFLNMLTDGTKVTMTRWSPNTPEREESFELVYYSKDAVFLEWSETEPIDLAVWKTGWRVSSFKDISKHFVREADIDRITGQRGYRISDVITTLPSLTFTTKETPFDKASMSHIVFPLAIIAEGSPNQGLCGSPWVVENPTYFGSTGKICGIHAFAGSSYIGAVPITIEALETVDEAFSITGPAMPSVLEGAYAPVRQEDHGFNAHLYYGELDPRAAFQQPRKSDIQPSPVKGEIVPVTHAPAVLSDRDPRLENRERFNDDLLKKTDFRVQWTMEDSLWEDSVKQTAIDIALLESKIPGRLLSLDEAINGVEGPAFMSDTGLEMAKSPGYPWNRVAAGKGKYPFFESVDGKWVLNHPELYDRVFLRLKEAREGRIVANSIWLDVMKDELRPLAKVVNGSTRIINAPPLDLMIVMNILCGAFRINWMDPDHVGVPLESALGIDPKDHWPKRAFTVISGMTKFGIDFTKFDSTQGMKVFEGQAQIINHWYAHNKPTGKDTSLYVSVGEYPSWATTEELKHKSDDIARDTLFAEIAQTLHLFGSTAVVDDHGLPSGVPGGFTTICNILVNKIIARATFIRHTGLHGSLYKKYVSNVFMGDDGEHVVHNVQDPVLREALLKYNRITLAETGGLIGLKATMPDKSANMTHSDTFEEMTFLKCCYVDNVVPGFYLPGMSKETIGNLINWYRPKHNPLQFETNLMEALKFAAPHGKAYYEELRGKLLENTIIQALYRDRMQTVLPSFEEVFYSTYLPTGLPKLEDRIFYFE